MGGNFTFLSKFGAKFSCLINLERESYYGNL